MADWGIMAAGAIYADIVAPAESWVQYARLV